MLDKYGYRPNVGIILINQDNKVFWGKRIREQAWQFPQGGINPDESPEQAMYRELHEEIGLHPEHVEIIGRTRNWLRYNVPERWVRREWRGHYRGQKQIWFLLRLKADDTAIELDADAHPEFDAWRWSEYWLPLDAVIEFKRGVYLRALTELAAMLDLPAPPPGMSRPPPGRSTGRNGRSGSGAATPGTGRGNREQAGRPEPAAAAAAAGERSARSGQDARSARPERAARNGNSNRAARPGRTGSDGIRRDGREGRADGQAAPGTADNARRGGHGRPAATGRRADDETPPRTGRRAGSGRRPSAPRQEEPVGRQRPADRDAPARPRAAQAARSHAPAAGSQPAGRAPRGERTGRKPAEPARPGGSRLATAAPGQEGSERRDRQRARPAQTGDTSSEPRPTSLAEPPARPRRRSRPRR